MEFDERPREQWIVNEQRRRTEEAAGWADLEFANAVRALREAYKLPTQSLRELSAHFISEAKAGLAGQPSSMAMIPTFVTSRVTGDERGHFFALDLGGTNFRVLRLSLDGGGVVRAARARARRPAALAPHTCQRGTYLSPSMRAQVGPMKQGKFAIPDYVKTSDSERLFGFIADAVATFLAKASPRRSRRPPQLRRARARAPASQSARRPRAGVRLQPVGRPRLHVFLSGRADGSRLWHSCDVEQGATRTAAARACPAGRTRPVSA